MQAPPIKIILEDKDFIAVNKPAGLLVHRTKNSKEMTLVDWIIKKYPEIKHVGDKPEERPGIVHRLDRDTSGVIIIARNQKFFEYLKKLFSEHSVKKNYFALAFGKMKDKRGVINSPISVKSKTVKRTIYSGKMTKSAVTEFRVLKFFSISGESYSFLKIMPKTGRTHQIRIHLASIGHPIVGDNLYGKRQNPWSINRQFLHAESIEFNLRDGERIKIAADLPTELKKIIVELNHEGRNS